MDLSLAYTLGLGLVYPNRSQTTMKDTLDGMILGLCVFIGILMIIEVISQGTSRMIINFLFFLGK